MSRPIQPPAWKRRQFIAAGAAAALLPAFLREAFACPPPAALPPVDDGCGPLPAGIDDVSAAFRRAVQVGKPLLVIIVPVDDAQKYARGQLWGEVLNHCSPSTWAALACVEVVCATAAALTAVVPAVVADPLFVLVETNSLPASATSHTTTVPEYTRGWGRGGAGGDSAEQENQVGQKRIALLGALVEQAVFGADVNGVARPRLQQRVLQTQAARGPGADDKRSADERASLLVQAGDIDGAMAAAIARLKVVPVRGSKWANGGGCGVNVEGETANVGIACGMGHTPALSRRFLYWFTKG